MRITSRVRSFHQYRGGDIYLFFKKKQNLANGHLSIIYVAHWLYEPVNRYAHTLSLVLPLLRIVCCTWALLLYELVSNDFVRLTKLNCDSSWWRLNSSDSGSTLTADSLPSTVSARWRFDTFCRGKIINKRYNFATGHIEGKHTHVVAVVVVVAVVFCA